MAHEHDDEHEHSHGEIHFQGSDAADDTLATLREAHPTLAECLDLTRRWADLNEDERKQAVERQSAVERAEGWMPGFHADGDKCAACGKATAPVFSDRFEEGALGYAAFLHGLPVHATKECLEGFVAKRRDLSPRGIDRARRELMRDLDRPSPRMSQFFRHDVLAQPPFGLEDWANSVAEAQGDALGRAAMKDIERLARWVHQRMFH